MYFVKVRMLDVVESGFAQDVIHELPCFPLCMHQVLAFHMIAHPLAQDIPVALH